MTYGIPDKIIQNLFFKFSVKKKAYLSAMKTSDDKIAYGYWRPP